MFTRSDRLRVSRDPSHVRAHSPWDPLHYVAHRRQLARARQAADDQIAYIAGTRFPDRFAWRASELTSADRRKRLSRTVRKFALMADETLLITAVPVVIGTLRPNRARLGAIADRLADLDEAIAPRGVVLLERLLRGGHDSPLYQPQRAEELRVALDRVIGGLETATCWGSAITRPDGE